MEYNYAKHKQFGQLGIIALKSSRDLGNDVNEKIIQRRKDNVDFNHSEYTIPSSFLVNANEIRFSNGEGKVKISETVRGKDIYILCDVGNYSCTYDLFGHKNRMGPDEHFMNLKRTLSAIGGKSRRITVIMPLLYESRQHRRKSRESLDCAMALQELVNMGVDAILTFDVHDPNIQNAIHLASFENFYPTFEIVEAILERENGLKINKDSMIVVSPDTGAMDRAIYYAGVLGVDVGLFYKRRDHSTVIKGKNPIISHEYMGRDVENCDILIVDDMIASGESVLDIAAQLKKRNARNIYIAATFGLFTEGIEKFDKYYKEGLITRVYSTNLTYVSSEVKNSKWFEEVDMSSFIANLIDRLNYDKSIAPMLEAKTQTIEAVNKHKSQN